MNVTATTGNQQTTTQTQATTSTTKVVTPEAKDIVTRASEVLPEVKPTEIKPEDLGFDRKKHEEVLSKLPPEVRASVDAYQKELFSGVNKKFEEAARLKKEAQATPKRPSVADLLKDPDFIREAQSYVATQTPVQAPAGSNLSDEEWSVLSPAEKAQFQQIQQTNLSLQTQMSELLRNQEDERIKGRFKNYDPQTVNQLQDDLLNGRIRATREHLWKVVDYEEAIQRAYKLGLEDRNASLQEKINANSPMGGVSMTQTEEAPTRQPNESFQDFWRRIAVRRLKQRQDGALKVS